RGIMHYRVECNSTEAILLADYLKAIITGQNLPADLDAQAQASPFYKQYDSTKPNWVRDPAKLANTDLTNAFTRADPGLDPGGAGGGGRDRGRAVHRASALHGTADRCSSRAAARPATAGRHALPVPRPIGPRASAHRGRLTSGARRDSLA